MSRNLNIFPKSGRPGLLEAPHTDTHTFLPYYHYLSFNEISKSFPEFSQKINSPITADTVKNRKLS